MVATLAFLYDRRVFLNMVAGGFKNDLAALNDTTPHDSKYHRLVEYTLILRRLLEGHSPVSFEGQFYCVKGLMLTPRVAQELFPGILVSGSSDAGMSAARAVGATAVKYPEPPHLRRVLAACGSELLRVETKTKPGVSRRSDFQTIGKDRSLTSSP